LLAVLVLLVVIDVAIVLVLARANRSDDGAPTTTELS
jgi:hypothetical protein